MGHIFLTTQNHDAKQCKNNLNRDQFGKEHHCVGSSCVAVEQYVQAVVLTHNEDAEYGHNRDYDQQCWRGFFRSAVFHHRGETEDQGDRHQDHGRDQEEDRRDQADTCDHFHGAHGCGGGKANTDHGERERRQKLCEVVVGCAVEPAFNQHTTEEFTEVFECQNADGEENNQSDREEVFDDAPEVRDEHQRTGEGCVYGHRQCKRLCFYLRLCVGLLVVNIRVCFLEDRELFQVPDQ